MPSQEPASPGKGGPRLFVLIPLIAVAVVAPSACYYEEGSYGYQGYGEVYDAVPYGAYRGGGPSPYSSSRPYYSPYPSHGYHDSGRHRYHHDGGDSHHYRQQQQEVYQRQSQAAARQQEERNESRRESQNEGWRYEDRNERRKVGAEESYEERKR